MHFKIHLNVAQCNSPPSSAYMTKLVHHCSPAMQGIEMHQILFHTQFTLPSFYIALLTSKTGHFVATNKSTSHSKSAKHIAAFSSSLQTLQ